MLNINTNLSSLIAQKSFKISTSLLNQTMERMTTGFKLNHASDNAANFSISTSMTTKMSSYLVAEDNTMMGMDLINTATSSMDLISEHIQRIRELAVQASNGTNGASSLTAINDEVNARVDEIQRIYDSSEYNGIKFGGAEDDTKLIHDIYKRDVSSYKTLKSVDSNEMLTDGTYSIKTAEELVQLATMTNNALIGEGVEFVLGADIDLSSYANWTPIGNNTNKFMGVFDGNGYVISNLKINTANNQLGLFGRTSKAEIKNVALENINFVLNGATSSNKHIGGLVGYLGNYSTISNCYVTGKIDARSQVKMVGGLVGQVYYGSTVDSCYSECNVLNVNTMGGNLCGVLESNSVLKNSFATGNTSGTSAIAGIAGTILTSSIIENCYTTGDVTGNQSAGIAGSAHSDSSIINTWTSSKVKAKSGTTTAGCVYTVAGAKIKNVYVLDENSTHKGIFAGEYRSSGTGNIVIEDSYYSSYYDNYTVPLSAATKTFTSNVNSYSGDNPFAFSNRSKIYTLYRDVDLQIGITSNSSSSITVSTSYLLKDLNELRRIGLNNEDNGNHVKACDLLLLNLDEKKLGLSSTYNRLESVLDEIHTKYDNILSSYSTIKDADIAEESSEYIKYQILKDASSTLLSTANQTPSIALQLI